LGSRVSGVIKIESANSLCVRVRVDVIGVSREAARQ